MPAPSNFRFAQESRRHSPATGASSPSFEPSSHLAPAASATRSCETQAHHVLVCCRASFTSSLHAVCLSLGSAQPSPCSSTSSSSFSHLIRTAHDSLRRHIQPILWTSLRSYGGPCPAPIPSPRMAGRAQATHCPFIASDHILKLCGNVQAELSLPRRRLIER